MAENRQYDIAFYCKMLHVSRQGLYKYLMNKDHPWKYQLLADAIQEIQEEDKCNDTYGRIRMYQALLLKRSENINIPSERTVYWVMEEIVLIWRYFIIYWNNRRICSANGGLPPMVKHRQYYDSLKKTA